MTVPRFISAVLTDDSKLLLSAAIDNPQYSKPFMHHVTIAYNPTKKDYEKISAIVKNGDSITIICQECIWDAGVEAVTVRLKKDDVEVPTINKHAHITISTDNTSPKESNDMLQRIFYIPKEQRKSMNGLRLKAIIKFEN